jgi:hypothetical protein
LCCWLEFEAGSQGLLRLQERRGLARKVRPLEAMGEVRGLPEISDSVRSTLKSGDGLGAVDSRKRPDFWGQVLTLHTTLKAHTSSV